MSDENGVLFEGVLTGNEMVTMVEEWRGDEEWCQWRKLSE